MGEPSAGTTSRSSPFVAAYAAATGEALDPFWVMAGHLEHDHDHWTHGRFDVDEPDLERAVRAITDQQID